jgi:hypothetical protein
MTDDDDDDDDDDEVIIAARDSRSPVCLNNCVRRQPVPGVSDYGLRSGGGGRFGVWASRAP